MRSSKTAFSLIELSIVVLIILILVSGLLGASKLYSSFRLISARSLTQSSPVPGIPNLVIWLETSSDKSFINTEASDGSRVSTWYNLSPQATMVYKAQNVASSSLWPTYKENCINNLPCLYFDGTGTYLDMTQSDSGKTLEVTYFVVASAYTSEARAIISGSKSGWVVGDVFSFRFGPYLWYQLAGSGGSVITSSYDYRTKLILTVVDPGISSIKGYVNGNLKTGSSSPNVLYTKNLSSISIGCLGNYNGAGSRVDYFNGDVGEIIIYSRALNSEERKAVEKYLSQKWQIALSY